MNQFTQRLLMVYLNLAGKRSAMLIQAKIGKQKLGVKYHVIDATRFACFVLVALFSRIFGPPKLKAVADGDGKN